MVLAEQGARGASQSTGSPRLGLTKGSFHHHFDGIADYHRALWARYESVSMDAIRRAVTAVADLPPDRALMIGASVALPRPTETDMREVFSLLATLVPSVH